jgi:hypothetical protein
MSHHYTSSTYLGIIGPSNNPKKQKKGKRKG